MADLGDNPKWTGRSVPYSAPNGSERSHAAAEWLVGPGELGTLIRTKDWLRTPLGPRERWPQSLRTVVGLVVESKLPMTLLWGPEWIVLYNDPCRAIYSDRHPRALGRPLREIRPEVWHIDQPIVSAVTSRGEAVFLEDELFPRERSGRGEDALFTVTYNPVRIENGSIGGILVTLQDTTAVVERSRLLRESEARFRAVVENSRDGINMLDLKTGKYAFMSPAQLALTGFSAEEINGFSVEEALARVHPDDQHISREQQRRIAAGEDPGGTPVEYRWKVKSGEYLWFSDSRRLVHDEQGRPVALVGVSRDVTERRRAEDALRASEQKYAAIFESSPFALAISRMPDGALAAVNDAFLQMFGATRNAVVGQRIIDLGICDVVSWEQVRAELLAHGSVRDFECIRSTKDGAQRVISLNLDYVSIGGEQHVLTTIQDVTARKEAEQAKRLYQRTKALDELKTRFFASVSHELRTPLALIIGPTERLLSTPDTPAAVRSDLAVVDRNARTLLGLVNDLLDIARLEAGRMKAEHAETDLGALARRVADHFQALSKDQRIALEVDGPQRLTAQVDPEQVQRILLNLLSNAFEFTPAGGRVRLTLRATREHARFEVADSGPGIPVDRRKAVFERFGQLDSSATRHLGGGGLGLSIVRELTSLHGGTIAISDAPEGGALFVVELPRAAPPGAVVGETVDIQPAARLTAEALRAHRVTSTPPPPFGVGPLVLVVEDNPEMSRFISEGLSDQFRVAVAYDGRRGLEAAMELGPELILCDIMMPEMSGEELVLAARRRPELDATPIVVLSAKADDEVRVRLLRGGAQDYLTKPFPVEELRARVSNLVENARLHRAEQRATQARDEVLGIVAHDLRNPLATIMLHTAHLRWTVTDLVRRARDAADAIDRAAGRMNRIIEDLLEITRLEAGGLELDRVCIPAVGLVAEVVELQSEQVASRSLELRCNVARGLPEVWVDQHRMLQVFENLIGNALKFTSDGSISIGAERRGSEVVFWVADTGVGIAAEDVPHLFDRFWQARSTKRGGAGLGLAIVKGIVETHGGRAWVESQVGSGTTFFFTVPIADCHGTAPR